MKTMLARLLFGPHYTAHIAFHYCDWHGRDSYDIILDPFRAKSNISAACRAVRLAQKECDAGWLTASIVRITRINGDLT